MRHSAIRCPTMRAHAKPLRLYIFKFSIECFARFILNTKQHTVVIPKYTLNSAKHFQLYLL